MPEDPLLLTQKGTTAFLTLNAPPGNAMNAAFFGAFARLCRDRLPALRVRGLIVHGSGRHFSSGADVDELRGMLRLVDARDDAQFLTRNVDVFLRLEQLPFPVIAAVSGCCLGAGTELALACHYRVAATRATFALPESTFGLMPGCGGTVRLPRLVGTGKAAEMILSGRTMLADEALAIGLVDAIVDRKELLAAAERLIRRLPPPAATAPQDPS
jgi:enoyl-CoA hydratase